MHTFKLWHYTSAEKHFTACSTQLYSRTLTKPCHNSYPLPALHSVISSPNARKEEECSSYDPGLCYSTPFGTCSYVKKGDIPCTSNPKVLCQRIVPPRSMVFYTLDVCTTEPCYSPELGWTEYSPPFQAHIKWRNRQQPRATMPPLQQLQDFHPYTLLVSTLRYVPRYVNGHQSFTHIYLLLNIA